MSREVRFSVVRGNSAVEFGPWGCMVENLLTSRSKDVARERGLNEERLGKDKEKRGPGDLRRAVVTLERDSEDLYGNCSRSSSGAEREKEGQENPQHSTIGRGAT